MEILHKAKRAARNPMHYVCHYARRGLGPFNSCMEVLRLRLRTKKLTKVRNIHAGKKCVIIGMGPSLQVADLDRFKGTYTIACNKIYLAYDQTDWRPDYYMVSDVLVAENNKVEINKVRSKKYFPTWIEHKCKGFSDINWIPVGECPEYVPGESVGFSVDLTRGIQPGGATVIYDMLQLAYHLGFTEVAIVGLDFSFKNSVTSGEKCEQGEILVSAGEVNHFAKGYRKPGETWTIPKMDDQRLAFAKALELFKADGRSLLNASRETKLDEIPRVDFDEYFPE